MQHPTPPMRGRAASVLWTALFSAATAALVTVWLSGSGPPSAPPRPELAIDGADLRVLRERVAQLEQRLAARPLLAEPMKTAEPGAGEQPARRAVADREARVETRITALEQQIAALGQRASRLRIGGDLDKNPGDAAAAAQSMVERRAAEQRRRADLQATILDPAAAADVKRQAWSRLRGIEDAYSDEVVAEMVRLGLGSQDARLRADIWRQADGRSMHDALVPALLRAVQTDPDSSVREEAAETLENYAHRPEVAQTLTFVAANDADEGVRRYAARSLERVRR